MDHLILMGRVGDSGAWRYGGMDLSCIAICVFGF